MKSTQPPSWTLNDLYAGADDPAIAADLEQVLRDAKEFERRYRGRVASGTMSPADLAVALAEYEAVVERIQKIGTYASLLFSADMSVPRHGALYQLVEERGVEINRHLTFFELEWGAVPDTRVREYLTSPDLARYRHYLEVERRMAPYRLSEPEELILDAKGTTGVHAFQRLFDEVLAQSRFEVRTGSKRERLTEEEVLSRLHDPRRPTRKAAADGLTAGLRAHSHLLGYVFNVIAADHADTDRLRRFPTAMAARNIGNEIDQSAVDALIAAVERGYPIVRRYYRLKRRLLGVDRLYDYDRYAPLAAKDTAIPWPEARRIVLDAYRQFSPDMQSIAERFFEGRWIDAAVRPGKRGGAFSHGAVPSVHPYVFLNYTGTTRDVMTLAHELGHGVHQYLARSQGCLQDGTPLTMAETASVFGEMLVFHALKDAERNPKRALALICGKIEEEISTVFRQVAMTRFEQALHDARRREGELPLERIDALWLDANRPMFGDSVTLTADYGRWWSYIPHFVHTPFYCYAYAFGALLVFALYRKYLAEGAVFAPKYMALLAAGGSDSPERLLAPLGIDLNASGFWDGGIAVLESWVDEAEALAERVVEPSRRRRGWSTGRNRPAAKAAR